MVFRIFSFSVTAAGVAAGVTETGDLRGPRGRLTFVPTLEWIEVSLGRIVGVIQTIGVRRAVEVQVEVRLIDEGGEAVTSSGDLVDGNRGSIHVLEMDSSPREIQLVR